MKRVLTLAIGLVLLLACVGTVTAGSGSANLVTNGGFEDPVVDNIAAYHAGSGLTGWTISPAAGSTIGNGGIDLLNSNVWTPHSGSTGNQMIDLAALEPGKISQTIPTTDLTGTYTISFWLAGNPHTAGKKVLKVYWDGNEVNPTTGSLTFDTTGTSRSNMGWTEVTISGLKATKTTTELVFEQGATDDLRCGVALDDISVVDPPVTPAPEFPSVAVPVAMLVGFIGIILSVQKFRKD